MKNGSLADSLGLNKLRLFCRRLIYGNLIMKLDAIYDKIGAEVETVNRMEAELQSIRKERDVYKNLVIAVGNTVPDLMWAKDLDGRYIYANQEICNTLFYGMDKSAVLGRNDVELAGMCKAKVGNDRHTFGEICANSDVIILDKRSKELFLEYGLVNGVEVYLEVHKAPFYNSKGELIGTVGTGRNVTETYLRLRHAIETCGSECRDILLAELDKYKFE
jgi:PAS domain-containing protein